MRKIWQQHPLMSQINKEFSSFTNNDFARCINPLMTIRYFHEGSMLLKKEHEIVKSSMRKQ
ncbi:CLUMA_CG012338, isoform A [Clunio marinus]|uniref:CLUMA_CG012338, isoform A n=1 Tax=Clunio marinus TaxID=568069 RepID=A0A1J1IET8_9DIPT|nr:CLUMA_CG012338, isoform A [Clunio marinus]